MKRFLFRFAFLAVLAVGLTAAGQFAQFPGTTTTFLRGDNTWATPTTFGAVSATTIAASGAQTNSSTLGVAGAVTIGGAVDVTGAQTNRSTLGVAGAVSISGAVDMASTLAVSGRSTLSGGIIHTPLTLTPASGGTNYGLNLSTTSAAYKSMTNHVAFTGLTNNASGAYCRVILYNGSGSDFDVRAPTGSIFSTSYDGTANWPTTVTNTTAVLVEVYGMGTASTNALWRLTRFVP